MVIYGAAILRTCQFGRYDMKKRIFFLLTLLTVSVVLFSSCAGGNKKPSDTTGDSSEGEHAVYVFMQDGSSEYSVVYPLVFADEPEEALDELRALVKENSKGAFSYKSDYLAPGVDVSSFDGEKEILIGDTNRTETALAKDGLREDDYVIKIVGSKLVVVGGCDAATAVAIRHFAAMFFSDTRDSLVLRDDFVVEHEGEYQVEHINIDDTELSEYRILYTEGAKADALFMSNEIRKKSGYMLDSEEYSEDFEGKAIVINSNPVSSGYSVTAEKGNIFIDGADTASRNQGVVRFLENVLLTSAGKADIDTSSFGFYGTLRNNTKLSVMSLNVYSSGYAENSVRNRYPRLCALAGRYAPDLLCLQDVSPSWIEFIKEGTAEQDPLTDVYAYVGTGRNNDEDSVMQAIFYKKSDFTLVDSGTFWLSETPDWESVGWDGRSRNICTWAHLKSNASGAEFVVMNTQLDAYGTTARSKGASLIVEKAEEFGLPVIFAGDFQAESKDASYSRVTESAFADTVYIAGEVGLTGPTVNGAFGNDEKFDSQSEFIFTSFGDFVVNRFTLLDDKVDDMYVSCHYALYTELGF